MAGQGRALRQGFLTPRRVGYEGA